MEKIVLNSTTTIFNYDDIKGYETCVVLINKPNRFYLIDTFCGPDSMIPILEEISKEPDKEVVVINTHFHWDHIWGNCAFAGCTIVASEKTYSRMDSSFDDQYRKNMIYKKGDVVKVLPNKTFDDTIIYPDDGIDVFYSPGHTCDSISIYDKETKTLYVGDNVEKPLIYVEDKALERYIETLGKYKAMYPSVIVGAHTIHLTVQDIDRTIAYLEDIRNGISRHFDEESTNQLHAMNLAFIRS